MAAYNRILDPTSTTAPMNSRASSVMYFQDCACPDIRVLRLLLRFVREGKTLVHSDIS